MKLPAPISASTALDRGLALGKKPFSRKGSRGTGLLPIALVAAMALIAASAAVANACPFCGAVQSTLAQDITRSDVAVVARLVELPPQTEGKEGELNVTAPQAKFAVIEVLRGEAALNKKKIIEAPFFEDKPVGGEYLILGAQPPVVIWSPPYSLTPRSLKYVSEITKLPATGIERLSYYQNYLEDKEDLLARDAFDEFALAPYIDLQKLKPQMQHDKLVERVQDPQILPSHRRLYLTMLGVCGTAADLPMLEKLLRSDDQKFKMGLDATVACYLTLKGADGLPLVEDLFLKTKQKEEFTDIFSVVMALRFLGQQENPNIPHDRIVAAMRLVLDHPRLADQAVMDLARWQDWSVMDRLVTLFKSPDPDTASWVRIPVINYLRACPLPKAKEYIEQLRKIDRQAVEQSETLYPIGPAVTSAAASRAGATAGSSSGTPSSNTFASGDGSGSTEPAKSAGDVKPSEPPKAGDVAKPAPAADATPTQATATPATKADSAATPQPVSQPEPKAAAATAVAKPTAEGGQTAAATSNADSSDSLHTALIGIGAAVVGMMIVAALIRTQRAKQPVAHTHE